MGLIGLLVAGLLGAPGPAPPPAAAQLKLPALRQELLEMEKKDQAARIAMLTEMGRQDQTPLHEKPGPKAPASKAVLAATRAVEELDRKHRTRLREIIGRHGWPGKSLVGMDGAQAAWLLVQHSDQDRGFQKQCLALMTAAPKDEVDARNVAYLTDRVLLAEGKKQRYGTQLQGESGTFKPRPIEDPAKVDNRRAEMGMEPLAEYLRTAQEFYQKFTRPEGKTKPALTKP
jgi:hypothetical protein